MKAQALQNTYDPILVTFKWITVVNWRVFPKGEKNEAN